MHITVANQEGHNNDSVLCIERKAGTSVVLHAEAEHLTSLLTIARSMKVDEILILVGKDQQDLYQILRDDGWVEADQKLLRKPI